MAALKNLYFFLVITAFLAVSPAIAQITPGDAGNFITIWNTENSGSSANNEIRIPHANGETYNFTLYWEDTTDSSVNGTETFTTPFFTVTFPDPGIYRVEITGVFPRIFFAGSGDRLKILSVEQWGDIEWSSMDNAFRRASNLEINAMDAPDLSNVLSMGRMFESATSVNSDLNNWDVSNVEDMNSLFDGATSFNGDISSWNVSSVTNMAEMFNNAREFNQDIGGWITSSVTDNGMLQIFQNARAFNQDISDWDVSGITNMRRMFNGAIVFNQNIGYDEGTGQGWDVSNVWNMSGMFQNADAFNGDISGWDVSSVMDMGAMFNAADDFNQDLNDWDVSGVTSMASMFQNAPTFNGNITDWNTGSVTNMSSMFNGSAAFNQDISVWNTASVTSMFRMFLDADAFDQNLGDWNVEGLTSTSAMNDMLNNTSISRPNYDGILTGWATQNVLSGITLGANGLEYCAEGARTTLIDKGWAIDGDILATSCPVITDPFTTTWNTSNSGDSNSNQIRIPLFGNGYDFTVDWGDGSDENFVLNPGLNTPHYIEHTYSTPGIYTVEIRGDFPRIYFNNSGDKEKILSVESWGEIVWDEMEFAFYGAPNLVINALDTADLSNVTSLYSMFRDAVSINSSLNQWDVSGIENMANMFYGATSFNQNLSDWETGNVEKMGSMFRDASNFDRDIGMWDISNVLLMENMLDGSAISVENYDNILLGWAAQTVQSNIELGADGLQYCFSQANRETLTSAPNSWSINGDSIAIGCSTSGTDPFITVWETDDNNIVIPTTDTGYNYAVYWEKDDDANVNGTILANTGDLTISVPQPGVYRVEIYEDFPRIHFASFDYPDSEKEELHSVEQWGDVEWSTMAFAFFGAVNLEINATDLPDLSKATSLEGMFGEALKVNGGLENWDVSNIQTMRRMFQGRFDAPSAFNGDISNWDVSSVTDMHQMFQHATSFNRGIGGWDVSSVENMRQMFEGAEVFNEYIGYDPGTGEGWDMSSVTEISGMFMDAVAFNQDIGNWDVSNVTNMGEFDGVSGGVFENATSFNQDLSGWDITGVTGNFGNDMFKLFDNSGLSRENYDALLIAWSALVDANSGPKNLNMGAQGLTFCAETARSNLIDIHGWTIDGDVLAGDCVVPQFVDATLSEVTATTPHTADGVDQSTVTVVLRDEEDDPISGFSETDFLIELTGSATASAIAETGTPGTYSFTVTDAVAEVVTVTVTAGGVELDNKPTIDFEAPPQVVSASNSEVTATTPHTADGVDQSTVTVVLRDEEDDPMSGFSETDFLIELTGSATASAIAETGTPGTYSFTATDAVAEVITVTVTAGGVELNNKPTIDFEAPPQVVSASNSVVTATTPHTADGADQSMVTVVLRDEEDDPISGFDSTDFSINITGSTSASEITETGTAGTYQFNVTNSVAEVVTVTVTAGGVELDNKPTIDFESPPQVVDAALSKVTATTPHTADGVDQSTVTVVLRDEENDPMSGFSETDFLIELTGSATASAIVETGTPGTYSFTVTDTVAEVVTVTVTAGGVELDDKPDIDFESPPQVVDAALSKVTATTPHTADGVDQSTVTVVLRDEEDDPMSGFSETDFLIELTGSATASAIAETGTPGTYSFTVTDAVAEVITVMVTAGGVELDDKPDIDFESPPQVVDAALSEVTATTPHTADGVDQSTVTVVLRDEEDDPISGFMATDFSIGVSGSATATEITETGTAGTYQFNVTNSVAEVVTVTVTADGVELDDKPDIDFEAPPQVVSASNSEVTATTPHTADGTDQSTVTVVLRDEEDDPMSGFSETDFLIELTGSATASAIAETGTPGTYSFTVTDAVAEVVTVTVTADGVELDDKPDIDFESPPQVVDAALSEVTATTPHTADGVDQSTVTVILIDEENNPISGYTSADFSINLSGSATAGEISETGTAGTYILSVANIVPETVTVSVTAGGTELNDKPTIVFDAPEQTVNAGNSEVMATSPHIADGLDESIVTVILRDDTNAPVTGFTNTDFLIELTGSATASELIETETAGNYRFTVTDLIAETVHVTITTGGAVLEDQPKIVFEPKVIIIDPEESEVTATSPHIANGTDKSIVTILLKDVDGESVPGLTNDDFEISIKGSGEPSKIEETGKPGVYTFTITNNVEEVVAVAVTVNEVVLNDQPEILFEAPDIIISPVFSEVTASSPHIADGEDASAVTVIVRDENKMAVSGLLPIDFSIEIKGNAERSEIKETKKEGVYSFSVLSKEAGTVNLRVQVMGVLLDQQAEIVFEDPVQFVDAFNSEVTATSPHLANGEDSSTVSIILRDEAMELIAGLGSNQFTIDVTGSAKLGSITESDPGKYQFSVTNTVVENVTIVVTVSGIELNDQVKIVFEKVPVPIPGAPEIIALEGVEAGVQIIWQVENEQNVNQFLIYKGSSSNDLSQVSQTSGEVFQFTDSNPGGSIIFYAVSAVNTDGVEGDRSDVVSFYNSAIIADHTQWKLVSNSLDNPIPNHQNTTLFSFSNRYEQATLLNPSRGYWIKSKTFDSEELSLVGSGLTNTTIQLREGWNLIGSLSAPINVEDIVDESNILTSTPIFRFNGNIYESVEILNPNDGHWIFANNEGSIELNVDVAEEGQTKQIATKNKELQAEGSKIWIEFEGENEVQKLAISKDPLSHDEMILYKLPPVAPSGIFDVRTDRNLSVLKSENNRIRIQSDYYPITVRIQGGDANQEFAWRFILQSENEEKTVDLLPGQPFQITKEYDRIEVIKVGMDEIITEHKLLPNYPNPFNPATTIQYQIGEQVHVQIEVYDVAGRRIQVLANEIQTTGLHQVRFDARQFSSGMYFVRLMAGNQPQIQKITLIK